MATPMQEQYHALKGQYPDCILLFRLGDFYEVFNDDAVVLSKVLGLTLTGRGEGENRVPMAGIPHHALNTYLPKIIKSGFKVALADQLTDPKPGQLVKRDVTKVITAGTIIDENSLDASENNYLSSIYVSTQRGLTTWGLAFADISTAEFKLTEIYARGSDIPKELLIELFRIRAAELIVPTSLKHKFKELLPTISIFDYDDNSYYAKELQQELLNGLRLKSFKAFGVESLQIGLIAAGKLYEYLMFNRKSNIPHLRSIQLLASDEYMLLDEATIRNLELIFPLREGNQLKTLFGVLNQCQTPMGQRRLRQWLLRPLIQAKQINRRLHSVSELVNDNELFINISADLNEITDMERVLAKLGGRSANARDLLFLKNGLISALNAISTISKQPISSNLHTYLTEELLTNNLKTAVIAKIEKAIKDEPAITITEGDIIKAGYDKELDILKSESQTGKDFIKNLETSEIKKTGINNLKVRFNRVFGYYIEVSKSNVGKVPNNYIRKQTTVNGERYITEELKQWEEKVLGAQERINLLEFQIFEKLRSEILENIVPLQKVFDCIANIDVLVDFARLAKTNNYVLPVVCDDNSASTKIVNGRHPVVETFMPGAFVPNDISFTADEQELIILTGPNMSGKSTFIRQVALITLMAQIGSFVPASTAEIAVCDRIFTRVGASDNLAGGESTFMVEMSETANILNNATSKSLVILDEVGRGTSTYDGVAIAWAIVEYLAKKLKSKTLFATHYHELLLLEDIFTNVKNYNVQVLEADGEVSFMHKIVKGGIDKSYGIHVAGLAGVPDTVIHRSVKILEQLQKRSVKSIIDKKMAAYNVEQYGLLTPSLPAPQKTQASSELKVKILKLDIDNLSPLQALTTLKELQDAAHASD